MRKISVLIMELTVFITLGMISVGCGSGGSSAQVNSTPSSSTRSSSTPSSSTPSGCSLVSPTNQSFAEAHPYVYVAVTQDLDNPPPVPDYPVPRAGSVVVIDAVTNTVVTKLYPGGHPRSIAATPDGSRVYFTDPKLSPGVRPGCDSCVRVIDTSTNTLMTQNSAPVEIDVGAILDPALELAMSPDGKRVYVTTQSVFAAIDTSTNGVLTTLKLPGFPSSLAITPDGGRAYISGTKTNTPSFQSFLWVIDLATNTLTESSLGNLAPTLAFSPDGSRLYLAAQIDPSSAAVSVVDTCRNSVVATIPVFQDPGVIAVAPDGKHLYVTGLDFGPAGNAVTVVDTATNTVTAHIYVPGGGSTPSGLAITPDGSRLYVTDSYMSADIIGLVAVIDTATNQIITSVPSLYTPVGVAVALVTQ